MKSRKIDVCFRIFDLGRENSCVREFLQEFCLKSLEDLEFKNMLSAEEDSLSAVLQITAGAGGTESCDWAEMLTRMYTMWAEKQGYKIRELNFQEGDL